MSQPSEIQAFIDAVVGELGDVLVHSLYFQTQDSAIRFVTSLSFVEQTPQGLSMPSDIKACALEASDGAVLCIAGKLKEEQSLEIRRSCLAQGVDDQFLAISKSQAATVCGIAQRVNDQLSAERATPRMAPADWYPDPAEKHQYRYWDGSSWTSNVKNDGAETVDPLPPDAGIDPPACAKIVVAIGAERRYSEEDNRGTRQESMDKAMTYWTARRATQKFDPFVLYVFDKEEGARQALLELEYMHLAEDSGKIVCSETFVFGYYKRDDGKYEAIVCGDDLSIQDWESARRSFTGYGGIKKNEQRPEKEKEAKASKKGDPDPKKVIFVREDKTSDALGTATYRTYKGPDAASAKAFLEQNPVSESLYYLVVETPDGNYGRDKDGMFKE